MTASHPTVQGSNFDAFCQQYDQLQTNLVVHQERYNASTKRIFLNAYLLALQSQDFGVSIRLVRSSMELPSSSQQVLLRALIESAVRLMFIDLKDEEGLNQLLFGDGKARQPRFKKAVKARPREFSQRMKPGTVTLDGDDAINKLKWIGIKPVEDIVEILKCCTGPNVLDEEVAAKVYVFYRELCPAAQSDLIYLFERFDRREASKSMTQENFLSVVHRTVADQ